jgi:hypothetical protein
VFIWCEVGAAAWSLTLHSCVICCATVLLNQPYISSLCGLLCWVNMLCGVLLMHHQVVCRSRPCMAAHSSAFLARPQCVLMPHTAALHSHHMWVIMADAFVALCKRYSAFCSYKAPPLCKLCVVLSCQLFKYLIYRFSCGPFQSSAAGCNAPAQELEELNHHQSCFYAYLMASVHMLRAAVDCSGQCSATSWCLITLILAAHTQPTGLNICV